MSSAAQIKAIHAMTHTLGWSDADYRAHLRARFSVASSLDLAEPQAQALLDELKALGAKPSRSPATTASGKYAAVLRALWISAFQLGVVRSPGDQAMLAFVERQTGLKHTRFLVEHAAASQAIEALKAWISREGGVTWPTQTQARRAGADFSYLAARETARAIMAKIDALGAWKPVFKGTPAWPDGAVFLGVKLGLPASFDAYSIDDWRKLSAALGKRLRARLAKEASHEAHA